MQRPTPSRWRRPPCMDEEARGGFAFISEDKVHYVGSFHHPSVALHPGEPGLSRNRGYSAHASISSVSRVALDQEIARPKLISHHRLECRREYRQKGTGWIQTVASAGR